ncbi:MAG TPA: hypothetical protein DEP87_03765 [Candidatus Pacebacteria bacterium]|nr:hypothetical protein [Candidatus Paceibacterota bacterium]
MKTPLPLIPISLRRHQLKSNWLKFWFGTIIIWLSFIWSGQNLLVFAETQTVTVNDDKVTATVLDHTNPSTPVLIWPTDNSLITTQKPGYNWWPCTDNVGVNTYQLTIDGVSFLSDLPTTARETSTYKLEVNSNGSLTVTPKTAIVDGLHTWKITAYDARNNSSNSATWSFTIDTQAPSFVLTQLGDVTTAISAQDSSTWPTAVISVSDNPATLVATTEANSSVTVTVTWTDQIRQTLTVDASSAGVWTTILGIVPRDTVITLDFLITDSAGLTSVLDDVTFLVPGITIPWLGSGASPTITPTPTSQPGSLVGSTEPTPTITPTSSTWIWEWLSGQAATEIRLPLIQEILLTITLLLPDQISQPLQQAITTPPATQPLWWRWAGLSWWLICLGLAWVWWWWRWRGFWFSAGWKQWWTVLGGWYCSETDSDRKGLVFKATQTGFQPLGLAKISFLARHPTNSNPVGLETIFSDPTGQFSLPNWPLKNLNQPANQYALTVCQKFHQPPVDFVPQPTDWPQPFTPYTYWHHQYRGGWLSLRQKLPFPSLVVLTQPHPAQTTAGGFFDISTALGKLLTRSAQLRGLWWLGWLGLSFLIVSLWGGWANWMLVIHLMGVGATRAIKTRRLKSWQLKFSQIDSSSSNDIWAMMTSRQAPHRVWWVPNHRQTLKTPSEISSLVVTQIQVQLPNHHYPAAQFHTDPIILPLEASLAEINSQTPGCQLIN